MYDGEPHCFFSLSFNEKAYTTLSLFGHALARGETEQYQARERPRQGLPFLNGP